MSHPVILIDDLKLAVFLLSILDGGAFRLGGGIGDALFIRRPREAFDAVLDVCQLVGLAGLGID